MSSCPPPTIEEHVEAVLNQVRAWRWDEFPSVPRGAVVWDELRQSDATHAEKCMVERIDIHDAAAGIPEPAGSLQIRAKRMLERYQRNGLTEQDAEKLLAWLDGPEEELP